MVERTRTQNFSRETFAINTFGFLLIQQLRTL